MKTRFWFRKTQGQPTTQKGIIYATITIQQKRSQPVSTGIAVDKAKWDAKLQQITGKNSAILNDELLAVSNDLLTIKQNLQQSRQEVTAETVRAEWLKQQKGPDSLPALMEAHEVYQRKYGRGKKGKPLTEGTFEFYKSNRAYFFDYLKNSKLALPNPETINGQWLTKYEKYLQTRSIKPLKQSSINYAVNYIKQVLKFSVANEYINKAPGIFHKLTPSQATIPAPLSDEEIQKLENTEFAKFKQRAVDCFLFLRYTGLHYIDGLQIKNSAIQTDPEGNLYLRVSRQKTEELAYIPYHPKAQLLVQKYNGLENLPFTSFHNMAVQLRKATRLLGIYKRITLGMARDTFANDCSNNMGMSDESIAAMLGHTTTKQVKKYRRVSISRITREWKV